MPPSRALIKEVRSVSSAVEFPARSATPAREFNLPLYTIRIAGSELRRQIRNSGIGIQFPFCPGLRLEPQ